MSKKPELTGIVGYLDEKELSSMQSQIGKTGTTDLRFESGNDQVLMRVKNQDIRDVSLGDKSNDQVKAHLILAPGSLVETVVKMFRDVKAIDDPTLSRLTAASSVSVSFV